MRPLVLVALALAACSPQPRVIASTPAMVVVEAGIGPAEATPVAQAWCQSQGGQNAALRASRRITNFADHHSFDCVPAR